MCGRAEIKHSLRVKQHRLAFDHIQLQSYSPSQGGAALVTNCDLHSDSNM
jgi:hypothetical protein